MLKSICNQKVNATHKVSHSEDAHATASISTIHSEFLMNQTLFELLLFKNTLLLVSGSVLKFR